MNRGKPANAVFGPIGPVAHMNEMITDEPAYVHRVGQPYGFSGPTITDIRVSRDGAGPTGFYDRVTVWDGEKLLFETALWQAGYVEYPHDENANPQDDIIF
jgi:hypothetical protein